MVARRDVRRSGILADTVHPRLATLLDRCRIEHRGRHRFDISHAVRLGVAFETLPRNPAGLNRPARPRQCGWIAVAVAADDTLGQARTGSSRSLAKRQITSAK